MRSKKGITDWLHVIVTVNKNRFLQFVVSDPPQDGRGKRQVLALHYVVTKLNSFSLNTVLLQLRFQEMRHTKDIVTMNRITRYTCINQYRILPYAK
jgi:hypothetical protein